MNDSPGHDTDSAVVSVAGDVHAAVNELIDEDHDAEDLLAQADVWLDVEFGLYDTELEVSVDFNLLRETTDYGGSDDG